MAHKKIIDSVKKQGQVAIKDLDEFLRFVINESDMRTYDDNYISILIPMKFDIDKVFGLDVCKRSDDDYVILYSCWYPNKDVFGRQFEMRLYHYDNSNDDDDLGLDIVMTQGAICVRTIYNFALRRASRFWEVRFLRSKKECI